MDFRESETMELKREYTEDIRKEVIAMGNSYGGILYVGIEDSGEIVGLQQPDEIIRRISNSVRDTVKPDITMFIRYETIDIEGKQIVGVHIQRGASRPYYLAAKGLRPEGVYVRQGTSCVPASDAAIRRMIQETDGDHYEQTRSLEQSLTFHQASEFFQELKLEFGPSQMRSLALSDGEGIYTNLGLLLSDQCPHTIKAATFSGADQQRFHDRREFTGSLLKQLNDAYAYLELRNQLHASFKGLYRTDEQDYPESALREALLNAIVHRDYSYSASTLISVYADRIEFVSVGGLIQGITLEDVLMGLSVCRNQKLAHVFYRLKLIEAYGTGIQKIHRAYEETNVRPKLQASSNALKITLPQILYGDSSAKLPKEMSSVLAAAQDHGSISRKDVEGILGVKIASAVRLLKKMVDENLLVPTGKGRNTRYLPR